MTSDGVVVKRPSDRARPEQPVEELVSAVSGSVSAVHHGTTVATNMILERKGARVGLVTTKGFADVLEIRRQDRPAIYDLRAAWPRPLVPRSRRMEVDERVAPDGLVIRRLDDADAEAALERLRGQRIESLAVCLLFAFADPAHERRVQSLSRRILGRRMSVSLSSEVFPRIGEFERTSATVLNAYVAPGIQRYLLRLRRFVRRFNADLFVMVSDGGFVNGETVARRPVSTLLSGPAAGVVGAQAAVSRSGLRDLITMDIGGTSTDVAVVPGAALRTDEGIIGGFPIGVPIFDIETVGAGGGSVVALDSAGVLRVGPESAGANPGPASYGRGGPLTLTDAHLVLGRVGSDLLGGSFRLDSRTAYGRAGALGARIGLDARALAWAAMRIAASNVERAARRVSLQRGYDPRNFALVAFGGAGPQLACEVADGLGVRRVLIPPHPGALAAYGLLVADEVRVLTRTVLGRVGLHPPELDRFYRELQAALEREMGLQRGPLRLARTVDVRYVGQTFSLSLAPGPGLASRFHEAHRERYGYARSDCPVEVVAVRLEARRGVGEPAQPAVGSGTVSGSAGTRLVRFQSPDGSVGDLETRVYNRGQTLLGRLSGPAIVEQYDTTVVVPPGWTAEDSSSGNLVLTRI